MEFSVLMPIYHGDDAGAVREAISSIELNTVRPSQIVLIIDGPICDELDSVVRECVGEPFTVVRLDKNCGIVTALNTGLDHCKFELVARCDADDINLCDRFSKQLELFSDNPNLAVAGGQIVEFCRESDGVLLKKEVPYSHADIVKRLKTRSPFNHMTVMFRKSVVDEVGRYPSIRFREDYALWASIIAAGHESVNHSDVLVRAAGGVLMYQRRGRPSHFVYELEMQRHLLRLGLIGYFRLLFNLFLRGGNMLVGPLLRGWLYRKFLRSRVE